MTSDSQLRWVGPEKGVVHLATAALVNAVWDLWAKVERKPLWKLLVDMTPEELVACLDFRYISDALMPEESTRHPAPQRTHQRYTRAGDARQRLSRLHNFSRLARLQR